MADRKLEAIMLHLLNTRADNGKVWIAITIPGVARFTRDDVQGYLDHARQCAPDPWYKRLVFAVWMWLHK
jgi:hypothetical protein